MSDVWWQMSDDTSNVRRLMTDVSCVMCDDRCLMSDVWCLMCDDWSLMSDDWCLMSEDRRLMSDVWWQRYDVRRLMTEVWWTTYCGVRRSSGKKTVYLINPSKCVQYSQEPMQAAGRTMWQQLWERTEEEFDFENYQGRRSPFLFWSKLAQRSLPHVAHFCTCPFAVMAERKGRQWLSMSERLSCSCSGFCGTSEQEAGAHVTCRLADGNLERIRRLFSNL